LAVRHKMVGLLVFEDTDLPRRRHKYKRCSSHPPRAVLELNHDGSDPMSPAFPASGLFLSLLCSSYLSIHWLVLGHIAVDAAFCYR